MNNVSDFDARYNIVNEKTPPNSLMRGRYKQSFAYYVLRERLPVIITQVLDNLSKDKDQIINDYGEDVKEELKEILGDISKLKYELQTDKKMSLLEGNEPDKVMWNNFLNTLDDENNSYFKACWLYAECYVYQKLNSIFTSKIFLKNYDYFRKQKENAITCCPDILQKTLESVNEAKCNKNNKELFISLLKLNLWGNRCDLSISAGKETKHSGNAFDLISSLDEYILVNDDKFIANYLFNDENSTSRIIDYVVDNSGYEIFTDFILADFLISNKLADKIRFHVKAIPWFISDVTENDFNWVLEYLSNHSIPLIKETCCKWLNNYKCGIFELMKCEYFWTGPYEFYRMNEVNPQLYEKLSEAKLVIFKGDLNYRKLIGDYSWNFEESFKTCLRGFKPSSICSLRTIKADLVCGLKPGVAEKLNEKKPDWMTTGEYGVIQFMDLCDSS